MVCRPLCRLPLSPASARLTFCRVASLPLSPTLCALASPSPPTGWAAASASDSLCPRFPLSSCRMGCRLCLRLSVPSLPLSSLPDGLPPLSPTLCAVAPSPHAGWDVVLGAAERAGRCYPRFGAERRPPATRQRGGGACRVDRGRGARPHSAELRSMRDQPPAPARAADRHIALPPLLQAADPSFPPIIPINPITLDYSSLLRGWGGLRPFLLKKQNCLHGRSDHGGSLSKRGRLPTFPLSQYHRRSEV